MVIVYDVMEFMWSDLGWMRSEDHTANTNQAQISHRQLNRMCNPHSAHSHFDSIVRAILKIKSQIGKRDVNHNQILFGFEGWIRGGYGFLLLAVGWNGQMEDFRYFKYICIWLVITLRFNIGNHHFLDNKNGFSISVQTDKIVKHIVPLIQMKDVVHFQLPFRLLSNKRRHVLNEYEYEISPQYNGCIVS